jgi:hypothetical protein
MTLPNAEKRSFDASVKLAQWSAANAIGTPESEWLKNGREVSSQRFCVVKRSRGN